MSDGKRSRDYRKVATGIAWGAIFLLASLAFAAPAMSQGNPPVFNNAPTIALPSGCSSNSGSALGNVAGASNPQALVMLCGTNIVTYLGNGDGTFATATPKTTLLSLPYSGQIALADIDGDGNLDLVTNDNFCNLDVFLGNGDGTFQATPKTFAEDYCGMSSEPFVMGDFNGKPDIIVENINGGTTPLEVFLDTSPAPGTVSFTSYDLPNLLTSSSQRISGLAAGNFSGQTVQDLAVGITNLSGAPYYTNTVEVLVNTGSGTSFTLKSSVSLPQTTGTELSGIAAGDFNGDGNEDVAAANPGEGAIFVLYGDGTGNLSSCSSSTNVTSIASCQTPAGQSNAGQTITGLTLGSGGLLAGKFNGLGGLLFKNGNDGFSVLLGAAGGTLQTVPGNYVAGQFPSQVVLGNLKGDAAPDAVMSTENGLSVFLNNTAGVLEGTQAFAAGTAPSEIVSLQNFFGDIELDVAVAQSNGRMVTVLGAPASGPNGTLTQTYGPEPVGTTSTTQIRALAGGCLTNSSPCVSPFVVAATYDTNSGVAAADIIYITTSETRQPTAPTTIFSQPGSAPVTAMAIGDFNGDGNTDLAFAFGFYSQIKVYTGNGDGTFSTSPLTISAGTEPVAMAVANFHGNGIPPDIAVVSQAGSVGILLNNSSSGGLSFQTLVPYPTQLTGTVGITVGDFNNDGNPDIAVASQTGLTILLNQGSGTFAATSSSPIQGLNLGGAVSVATADFNGDGNLDLAVTNSLNDTVEIFLGDGTGNFTTASPPAFSAGLGPDSLLAADFNGDGKPDIAVANGLIGAESLTTGNMVAVLLNGPAASSLPITVTVSPPTPTLAAGGTQQFSAVVAGSTNMAVTWSIDESGGGTISLTGLYMAPEAAGTFHVRATSSADSTKYGEAGVTVLAPPPISVTVIPPTPTLAAGGTQQFSAAVAGSTNMAVTWSIDESGGGTISLTGLYMAPEAAGTFHVRATSSADSTKYGEAAVSVLAPLPPASIDVTETIMVTDAPTSPDVFDPETIHVNDQVTVTTVMTLQTITTITGTASNFSGLVLPGSTALVGNPVTVTVATQPMSENVIIIPTGSFTVTDGLTPANICTGTLNAGGVGSCQLVIMVGTGTLQFTGTYLPDVNAAANGLVTSISVPVPEISTQIINCGTAPAAQTAAQGTTVTFTVPVCLAGDIQGDMLTFTVTDCPADALCLTSTSPIPNAAGAFSGIVTITLASPSSVAPQSRRPWGEPWPQTLIAVGALLAMLMALRLAGQNQARSRLWYAAGLAIALALLLSGINGCSSGGSSSSVTDTPPNSYTVNAAFTAGNFSVHVPLNLTVTK